ncbi:hypothetical protein BpHYR1_025344 [Brachionus plicatilis]|uniref:Uncharacterized protein n=1 Tax=Brachionus plicatilis TaxID=10195 RepID=A0A3M7RJX0_BRAPC|nr:hypothetical protein BpHYR1_025344 [Brachionus plicatilis]
MITYTFSARTTSIGGSQARRRKSYNRLNVEQAIACYVRFILLHQEAFNKLKLLAVSNLSNSSFILFLAKNISSVQINN